MKDKEESLNSMCVSGRRVGLDVEITYLIDDVTALREKKMVAARGLAEKSGKAAAAIRQARVEYCGYLIDKKGWEPDAAESLAMELESRDLNRLERTSGLAPLKWVWPKGDE